MGLSDFLKSKQTVEEIPLDTVLEGNNSISNDEIEEKVTYKKAIGLPNVYSNVELISNTVAGLEIKLYKEVGGTVEEVKGDIRTTLLNDDTGNLMTGDELKKAMVRDYLMHGVSYIYKNGYGKNVKSLHYLPKNEVHVIMDTDPIFRSAKLRVREREFYTNDFIIVTKNSINGVEGVGILKEGNSTLKQALDNQEYTSNIIKNGGVKRGVLQSTRRLTQAAIDELKKAWRRLYAGNNDCIVLNEGITYKELQQTSSEMELNDSKKEIDLDISRMFNVPCNLYNSNIPQEVWELLIKTAIMPILLKIEKALNKSLLSLDEKGVYYFAFDTKQLNKGDIEKRYRAYKTALESGFMTIPEVRFEEDMQEIQNLDFIRLSLADVLLNTKTGEIYTPNMDTTHSKKGGDNTTLKGGEDDGNGNS